MTWNDWVTIMDVSIATLCGALVGVAGSIFVNWLGNRKGYKDIDAKIGKLDNTTLSGQHESLKQYIDQKVGKLDNTTLSGQHEDIKKYIDQKTGKLDNTTLSGQNSNILRTIQNLHNELTVNKEKEDLKRRQLTGDQSRIEQSIAALSAFSQVMLDLQAKNSSLMYENQQLKQENAQLKERVAEIRPGPEETPGEEQVQHLM